MSGGNLDNCPVTRPFSNSICIDQSLTDSEGTSVYGKGSRCFIGTFAA